MTCHFNNNNKRQALIQSGGLQETRTQGEKLKKEKRKKESNHNDPHVDRPSREFNDNHWCSGKCYRVTRR